MRSAISLDATVKASREQVSCNLVDEVIVLSLRNGGYFGLNPVAATVWEMIQETRPVVEVRDKLLQEYVVEADECTRELLALLQRLAEWELVEVGNSSGQESL